MLLQGSDFGKMVAVIKHKAPRFSYFPFFALLFFTDLVTIMTIAFSLMNLLEAWILPLISIMICPGTFIDLAIRTATMKTTTMVSLLSEDKVYSIVQEPEPKVHI